MMTLKEYYSIDARITGSLTAFLGDDVEDFSIWLADADGNRYRTFLKHHIRIGTIVSCRLGIRKLSNMIDIDVLTVKTPKDYRVKSSSKRK